MTAAGRQPGLEAGHSRGTVRAAPSEARPGRVAARGAVDVKSSVPRRLLSLRHAGQYLDVSYWTVRGWVEAGKLRAVRLPGSKLLRLEITELERFVAEHRA